MTRETRSVAVWSALPSAVFIAFAAIAETDVDRWYLIGIAALASVLTTASVAAFVLWFRPRFGPLLATALLGMAWFAAASIAALVTPLCTSADEPVTCAPREAVSTGYPFLLIPPVLWLVSVSARLVWKLVIWAVLLPKRFVSGSARGLSSPASSNTSSKKSSKESSRSTPNTSTKDATAPSSKRVSPKASSPSSSGTSRRPRRGRSS